MPTTNEISSALSAIDHACDGPTTAFVLIARACALAARNGATPEACANALYEALGAQGYLTDLGLDSGT